MVKINIDMIKIGNWWAPSSDKDDESFKKYKHYLEWQNHFVEFVVEIFFPDHWPPDGAGNYKRRTAIDVGASVGQMALGLADYFDHVISFEPHEEACLCYTKNMKEYNKSNYTLHTVALSDSDDSVYFDNSTESSVSRVYRNKQKNTTLIYPTTLDRYNFENVDLIKIDVESWELKVLNGATQTILKNRPVVIVEVLPNKRNDHTHLKNVFKALGSLGYVNYMKRRNDYIFVDVGRIRYITKNLLYLLDHPYATSVIKS